jgi:hypothetical protein
MNTISVIIPTCRASDLLWQTLESVLEADGICPVDEILVVPNAGAENTSLRDEILCRYGNCRIRVHDRQDAEIVPVFENWNACVSFAASDLVHLLHDDDLVSPHFYEQLRRLNSKWPSAVLYYQSCVMFGTASGYVCPITTEMLWKEARVALAQSNRFACPGVVFRKSQFDGFDCNLKYTGDWKAWYELSKKGAVVISPYAAAAYRVHEANTTAQNVKVGRNFSEMIDTEKALRIDLSKDGINILSEPGGFARSMAMHEAHTAATRGDHISARTQLRCLLRHRFSLRIAFQYLKSFYQSKFSKMEQGITDKSR